MPKLYSKEEKKSIIKKLKNEANILMQEKGVKKTTVDELVKRAGIPKGTFYLFYPSKEMLLFDVSQDFHEQVDSFLQEGISKIIQSKNKSFLNPDLSDCIEELTDLILEAMEITYNSCLSVLLNPESINLILSKIPQKVLDAHRKSDSNLCDGFFKTVADKKGLNVEALSGSFMLVIFGGMYKTAVGIKNWKESMKIVLRGIVMQLI